MAVTGGLTRWILGALGLKGSPLRHGPKGPFVFIHINKTGGTSVGRAIGLPIKDHLTAREVIARIGRERWNEAFTFAVVRNPWDKAVSLYEYRRKKDRTGLTSEGVSFHDWVRWTMGPGQDPRYYNNPLSFQPQVEWLKDDEGAVSLDVIARFERLSEDFERIKRAIGIDADLPRLNATRRKDYRSYYDAETAAIVARWFADDIERFGYRFDPAGDRPEGS